MFNYFKNIIEDAYNYEENALIEGKRCLKKRFYIISRISKDIQKKF